MNPEDKNKKNNKNKKYFKQKGEFTVNYDFLSSALTQEMINKGVISERERIEFKSITLNPENKQSVIFTNIYGE